MAYFIKKLKSNNLGKTELKIKITDFKKIKNLNKNSKEIKNLK